MAAGGVLQGETVLVPDEKEANTLYNKGMFGVPQSGGAVSLDLVEALYLVEHNRLEVEGHDVASLLRHASQRERDFEIRYVVYRDLRARSFIVKPSGLNDWNLYRQGTTPGRSPSTHLVRCVSERASLDPTAVAAEVERARKHEKKLLLAVVDEEGDLTYYDASLADLASDVPRTPKGSARANLLADRVVVLDRREAERLFGDGYFGRDIGLGLQLSLPEALYLVEENALRVTEADGKTPVSAAALAERARGVEPDFELRHALYRDLRRRGLVVKTGLKFGTHFRAYLGAPEEEHAPFLVHAVPRDRALAWAEVAGFVRLAHGVRKRLFFAVPQAEPERFVLLELARKKP